MTAQHSPVTAPKTLSTGHPARRRNAPSAFLSSITSRLRIGPKSLPKPRNDHNQNSDISLQANPVSDWMDMQIPISGQIMVEIGCVDIAACLTTADLLGPHGKLIAIDSSPSAVATARKRAASAGTANVEFHLCRVDSIPLPSGTCDWVISRAPVYMAGSRMAILREISRVLKPGGNMILHDVAIKRLLPPELAETLAAHSYGLAGAIEPGSYEKLLLKAGMSGIGLKLYDLGNHIHQIFETTRDRKLPQNVPNGHTIYLGGMSGASAFSDPPMRQAGRSAPAVAGHPRAQVEHKLTDYLTAIRISGQRLAASSAAASAL